MYRHALCIYPYRRELSQWAFCPPLGLEFIAAVLKPFAQSVEIRDLRKDPGQARDFFRPETDLVCFSVNWERDLDFIRKQIAAIPPGPLVVMGGRHATEDPKKWFEACPNLDILIRGDGEEAMEMVCQGKPLEEILGISFRKEGRVFHNPVRILGPLADGLYPDRALRKYKYHFELEGLSTGLLFDTLSSSRGCPFHCQFCSFSRNPWGTKRPWSGRSPESVVRELSEIQAPFVAFTDDNFSHDPARVEGICDLLLKHGIRKKYIVNARIEIARNPALLKKMEEAGFMMLLLGIESAQDKTLRSMGKGFTVAKAREYFQVLRQTRMILLGYFIVGLIGESAEEMLAIAPFAKELGLDAINLTNLRTSPFSGLEALVAQNPGYRILPSGKICSDRLPYPELRKIRRRISRSFYTPAQWARLARKAAHHGALRYLPGFIFRLPRIAWQTVGKAGHRRRRRERQEGAALHAIENREGD